MGKRSGHDGDRGPYQEHKFWTNVLKQTNTGGSAGFSWWNLQLYGGAIRNAIAAGLATGKSRGATM